MFTEQEKAIISMRLSGDGFLLVESRLRLNHDEMMKAMKTIWRKLGTPSRHVSIQDTDRINTPSHCSCHHD